MKQSRPPSRLPPASEPARPPARSALAHPEAPRSPRLDLERSRRLGHAPGSYATSGSGRVQRSDTDSEDSVKLVVKGVKATSPDKVEAMKFGGGSTQIDEKRHRELLFFVQTQAEEHFGTERLTEVSLAFEDFGGAVGTYIYEAGQIVEPLLFKDLEGAKAGEDKEKLQELWKEEHGKEVDLYEKYLAEVKKLDSSGLAKVTDLLKVADSMHLAMNIVNDIMIEWKEEPKVTTLAKSGTIVATFTAGQVYGLGWVPSDACYIWNVVKIGDQGNLKTFLGEIAALFLGKEGKVDIYMEAEPWVAKIYKERFGAEEVE